MNVRTSKRPEPIETDERAIDMMAASFAFTKTELNIQVTALAGRQGVVLRDSVTCSLIMRKQRRDWSLGLVEGTSVRDHHSAATPKKRPPSVYGALKGRIASCAQAHIANRSCRYCRDWADVLRQQSFQCRSQNDL